MPNNGTLVGILLLSDGCLSCSIKISLFFNIIRDVVYFPSDVSKYGPYNICGSRIHTLKHYTPLCALSFWEDYISSIFLCWKGPSLLLHQQQTGGLLVAPLGCTSPLKCPIALASCIFLSLFLPLVASCLCAPILLLSL